MKLESVQLEKDDRAFLNWESAEISLKPGYNEVVIRDFESCESLLTEYLDVEIATSDSVRIGRFEWEVSCHEQEANAVTARTEIESLEKELDQLEGELSKICDQQRQSNEASSTNPDADVETQDESSDDSHDGSRATRAEKIKLEKLRSQKYKEVRSTRTRLTALRKQDRSLSRPGGDPIVSREIKISCYNTKPNQQMAKFIVKTLWANVNRSLGFMLTFPTGSLEGACRLTETLEITQNTDIDWENCQIWGLGFSVTDACSRGIPALHYGGRNDATALLFRTFDAYESKHCVWSIRLKFKDRWRTWEHETHICKIYAAGKFVGEFDTVCMDPRWSRPSDDATYRVKGVMIDYTITVQNNSDGSQQLTLSETEEKGVSISVFAMWSPKCWLSIYLKPGEGYTLPLPGTEEAPAV